MMILGKLRIELSLLVLGIVFQPVAVFAADYYIDQAASNASDSNAGTVSTPWKTITKANSTLRAGDTVYIKAGTYSTFIEPANSGTDTSRIAYKNFGSDVVTISGGTHGIHLNARTYVTVQGINVKSTTHLLFLENHADHNQIFDCSFEQSAKDWDTSVIHTSSQYNHLKNLKFSKGGWCNRAAKDDVGSVLDIGDEYSSTDLTRYNLIENSEFFHGGHHVMGLFGDFNTVRNNYFHNEVWSNGYGNRALYMNGADAITGRNLVEGNAFGYSALPCDWDTGNGPSGIVSISTPENIFRYNRVYYGVAYGLGLAAYTIADGFSEGRSNKIFQNTFFANGFDLSRTGTEYHQYNDSVENTALTIRKSYPKNNVIKSNLFFANRTMVTYSEGADSNANNTQVFAGNYIGESQGNPLFVNAPVAPNTTAAGYDFLTQTVPDLRLNATSPAKGLGVALTTVASSDSGSGVTILVADGSYFQDGTRAPAGTVQADWIAIGSSANIVQIASISGNTVTLKNSITRAANNSIWLFKKSDGVQVLYGTQPEPGAYEIVEGGTAVPAAPTNLKVN